MRNLVCSRSQLEHVTSRAISGSTGGFFYPPPDWSIMTAVPTHPPAIPYPVFIDELDVLIRARYPLIYLVTWEEQRVDALLASLAESHGKALYTWSVTQGLCRLDDGRNASKADGSTDSGAALAAVEKLAEPALVVFKDFHPYLNDAAVIRRMRELARTLKSTFTTMMLVSPVLNIPPELEKEISVLDVPPARHRGSAQAAARDRGGGPRGQAAPSSICATRTSSPCSRPPWA